MADKYITQYFTEFDKAPASLRKMYKDIDTFYRETNSDCAPKYDGCCGVAFINTGCNGMLSRTGENYSHSTQHILSALREQAGGAKLVVIGEVWSYVWPFQELSGIFRRVPKTPQDHANAKDLVFVIHDVLTEDEWAHGSAVPHAERLNRADDWEMNYPLLSEGDSAPCIMEGEMPSEYARRLKECGGFDGCIVRTPQMGYVAGETEKYNIFKVKPTYSLDLLVIYKLVVQQPTKLGGQLIVQLPDGKQQCVGSGLTQANLRDSSQWAGKIAEIEFMGYTEDGLMRETRFKGLRYDKLGPDAD